MQESSQHVNKDKIFARVSAKSRRNCAIAALCIFAFFLMLNLDRIGKVEITDWFHPCGFKQRYDKPCPTCGMTRSAKAFSQAKIVQSFSIQPAGTILCILLAFSGVLSFIAAVFGVYFCVLKRIYDRVKVRYMILAFLILIALGWAITLVRG